MKRTAESCFLYLYDLPGTARSDPSQHLIARPICLEKSDHPLPRYISTAPDLIRTFPVLLIRANPPSLRQSLPKVVPFGVEPEGRKNG